MGEWEAFKAARETKRELDISDLCADQACDLIVFASIIMRLDFDENPDYDMLRNILQELLSE